MGCDIHIVLERKFDEKGPWVGIREYSGFGRTLLEGTQGTATYVWFRLKARNYEFFNDLAGVRGDGSSFGYAPRGLPEDMSTLSEALLADDADIHSASWLTMEELQPILVKHFETEVAEIVEKKLKGEYTPTILQLLVDNGMDEVDDYSHPKNYRLVFGFDN